LKFLATSLVSSQNLFRNVQKHKVRQAFLKWQYNVSIRKIAEKAFNRVVEINHRHSKARFRTGVYLLKSVLEEYSIQGAFNRILSAAHMTNQRGGRYANNSDDRVQSRSRSFTRYG
jgi:ribosome-associated toxin RatA of RatAB toxin-antitoxin module